jgi:hypothetical protein
MNGYYPGSGSQEAEEVMALDLPDGEFPPGLWVSAGRLAGEFGVYLGAFQEVQHFVPESQIRELIADLKRQGETTLAEMVENIQPDVRALRTGKQKLVRDLGGKRIRPTTNRKERP